MTAVDANYKICQTAPMMTSKASDGLSRKPVLDAKDLQTEYGMAVHMSYEVLRRIGVRITPRRLVVGRERLERYLNGED
jgi:hypothetical protein